MAQVVIVDVGPQLWFELEVLEWPEVDATRNRRALKAVSCYRLKLHHVIHLACP